ncbi:pantothenate kinase [Fictibacillus macauensis ZFHKF-1]|uniref:Type III pantothenate kinase n=1 Tax=Fictibacillus macauensis ZFHKF-1 TaxID=1196324 RepID=I8IXF5_9BACL|nr:type III pantothenate kinase [Fictibacillus macauensis]EIT84166.1 pantothenate kinase [Fictibacillus macauensis ZFHKF-1]
MIFVFDVGNTNIVLGLYHEEELLHHWRISTAREKTEDEYGMLIVNLFKEASIAKEAIEGIIISSVVPHIMSTLERMCLKYFHRKPLLIGPGIKTGLNIKYENPREVGADRIVNAVAAIQLYGAPVIVVDFGTATTYCYINEQGHYMGGAIAPGINVATEGLYKNAAKLPRIEISKPPSVIGKNTVNAMQSGLLFGYVGQVEGIVKRIKQETNVNATVVATGGMAGLIAEECAEIDVVDPFLTLKGLHVIYCKNTHKDKW